MPAKAQPPRDIVSPAVRSRMMRAVGRSRTAEEDAVDALLRALAIRYTRNAEGLPGRPDFANPRAGWAIFVHGCFWHGHLHCAVTKSRATPRVPLVREQFWRLKLDDNRRRDRRKADALRRMGLRVLTIWGCALRDPDRVRRRVLRFLTAPG